MDVAASTTATGRKLLIYAREIIENVYKNMTWIQSSAKMITNAEYIYGDTDSVFFTFNLKGPKMGNPFEEKLHWRSRLSWPRKPVNWPQNS